MAPFRSLADVGKLPDGGFQNLCTPDDAKSVVSTASRQKVRRSNSKQSISGASEGGRSRASTAGGGISGVRRGSGMSEKRKVKGPTLMFQATTNPGKLHLRELDPRRIVFQECASTRVVLDWRKNRWEGTNRLVDRLLPTKASNRMMQYAMKLTGVARVSTVPEGESEPSSEEGSYEEGSENGSDDEIVNSDSEMTESTPGSANRSTATGSHLGGSIGGSMSGISKQLAHAQRRQNKAKNRMTGWLSSYSGCTKGHGERLQRKIYKPRCEDARVKMNSGVKELLMARTLDEHTPCFCSLQCVNFRNFLLGNRGVVALWPLLRYARALKALNLAGNDIHDTVCSISYLFWRQMCRSRAGKMKSVACSCLTYLEIQSHRQSFQISGASTKLARTSSCWAWQTP